MLPLRRQPALAQLAELRRAGGSLPASQAAQPQAGAGTAPTEPAAVAGRTAEKGEGKAVGAAGADAGAAALPQQGSQSTAEAQAAR